MTRNRAGAHPGRLVVGIDGTPASESVLEWTAVLAEQLNVPVVAVTTAEFTQPSEPAVIDDGGMLVDPVVRLSVPLDVFRSGEAARGDLGGLEDRRLRIVASVRNRHPRVDLSQAQVRGELAGVLTGIAGEADFIVVAEPAGSAGRSTSLSSYYRRYARSPVLIPPFEDLRSLVEVGQADQVIEGTLVEVRRAEPSGDHGVLVPVGDHGEQEMGRPSHWFG